MKKIKNQNGITLVVLVTTIVVLLILAAVTVRVTRDDSVISYAKNTQDEYQTKQENAQLEMDKYTEYLNDNPEETTLVDCDKCDKGKIVGYMCSKCNEVSTNIEESRGAFAECYVGALGCGWASEIYYDNKEIPSKCEECGGQVKIYSTSGYLYSECGHINRTGQGEPQTGEYDCSKCKGNGYIYIAK